MRTAPGSSPPGRGRAARANGGARRWGGSKSCVVLRKSGGFSSRSLPAFLGAAFLGRLGGVRRRGLARRLRVQALLHELVLELLELGLQSRRRSEIGVVALDVAHHE